LNNTTGGTPDLSFTGDRAPGQIAPENGAIIADKGDKTLPSTQDCANAFTSTPASVTENSQEFYCIKTGDGKIYLMQVWEAFLVSNIVKYYYLTFWSPTSNQA
jgi:hypothetical protein